VRCSGQEISIYMNGESLYQYSEALVSGEGDRSFGAWGGDTKEDMIDVVFESITVTER
jgi:hypothetical protein